MHATRRTWRRAMCSTGANRRKRSLRQTSSPTFTRQRASRNFSRCWMRRLRRDETTVRGRRRTKTGHSTEAPRDSPSQRASQRARVCVCVLMRVPAESVFYQCGVEMLAGACVCVCVCVFERTAKIVF